MADTPDGNAAPLTCSGVIPPLINEEKIREIVRKWLDSKINPFIRDSEIRIGKAVLIYYPFWKFSREDGGEDVIVYRPACGTLLPGMQNMARENTKTMPVPEDANILPVTAYSSVYLPDLHGIARGEELIAIPFWLVSYKVKNSIYMITADGETGVIYPSWHPVKEPVNWKKTALIAFIPMALISILAVYVSPWFFLFVIALLIFFFYQSQMIGVIDLKCKEGKDGA